ncbi:hypothetical protein [Thauera sp. SDU_THAU2]|uniref:hypothetical protein n=1 Tax=Thauera sp. SDU_THAU2 TaxID=3136633 RepID=UPI00311DA93F
MRPDLHPSPMPRAIAPATSSGTSPAALLLLLGALLLSSCTALPHLDKAEDGASHHGETQATTAEQTMQAAIRAARPRQSNLPRARSLLQGLLAAEDAESRALHPYARALLEQVQERQRLAGLNERLGQQLEQSAEALKDSEQRNEALQRKLDALAEIERSLTPPVPAAPRPRSQ